MNRNPNQSKAIAYLRQLCCSGLSKETVIPEFLRAVQTVLPSGNNVFSGSDETFRPSYHILGYAAPDMDEIIPIVISNYFTPERGNRAAAWLSQRLVFTDWLSFDKSFFKSDMYNLVCRPFDQHHGLHAMVLQDGKPLGMLSLYRPRQQKPSIVTIKSY